MTTRQRRPTNEFFAGRCRPFVTVNPRARQPGGARRRREPPYTFSMTSPSDSSLERWLDRFDPHAVLQWVMRRRTRLAAAWIVAAVATVIASYLAWYNCYDENRVDHNWGHMNIDFSGQWLLAAMFASGEGRHLY